MRSPGKPLKKPKDWKETPEDFEKNPKKEAMGVGFYVKTDVNDLALVAELGQTTTAVHSEVKRAIHLHGPFHSAHEAYAVILEELDEFWEEVRKKKQFRTKAAMREELIHIAATAIKAIVTLGLSNFTDPRSQM